MINYYTAKLNRLLPFCLFLIFSLLVFSCEFEPSGEYKIKHNYELIDPQIEIISLDLSEDTLIQYYNKGYSFELQSNKQIYSTRIWLDDQQLFNQGTDKGVFYIHNEDYAEGYHTLKLEVITNTGSNSIADQIGVETFQLYKKMHIYIRRKFSAEGTSLIHNNKLVVSWEKYEAPDLLYYQIKKTVCGKVYDYAKVVDHQFTDNLYVGEKAHYIIYSVPNDSTKIKSWASIIVDHNLPLLYTTATDANEYTLNWKQSFTPDNIDHFEIAKMVDGKLTTLETVNKETSTYRIFDEFDTWQTYFVRTIPKVGYPDIDLSDCFESSWSGHIGDQFAKQSVNGFFDLEDAGITYYMNDSLYYYAFKEKEVVAKQKVGFNKFSPNGNLTASPKGYVIKAFKDLDLELYYPKEDLRLQKVNLQKFGPYAPLSILLSDAGIGAINHNNGEFSLVNFNSEEILVKNSKTTYNNVNCISSDGKYLIVKNDSLRLLKYDEDTLSTVYKIPTENIGSTLGFFGDDSGYFYYQNGWELYIADCVSQAQIGSYSLYGERITDIDFENNLLLTVKMSSPYTYTLRDFLSGGELGKFDKSSSVLHLSANRLVSKTGECIIWKT